MIGRILPIGLIGALAASAAAQPLPPAPWAPPTVSAPVTSPARDMRAHDWRHRDDRRTSWRSLGAVTLRGRAAAAAIDLPLSAQGGGGRIGSLLLISERGSIELHDVVLTMGNGRVIAVPMNVVLSEGTQRAFDLPGDARVVRRVELRYRKLAGAGRARIALYGRTAVRATVPAPVTAAPAFDTRGWHLLGEQRLVPSSSGTRFPIGRERGGFSRIILVVEDAELDVAKVDVILDHEMLSPGVRQRFHAGSRTRVINLPVAGTPVRAVDLYFTSPTGATPRVQIWGQ